VGAASALPAQITPQNNADSEQNENRRPRTIKRSWISI
jgi:hypothetical protein